MTADTSPGSRCLKKSRVALSLSIIFVFTFLPLAGQKTLKQPIPIRVACVGNSVTYGTGITGRDSLSYPAQLQKMLGKSYAVGNFGYGGASLLKKGFKPYYKTTTFIDALSFRPDVAVIHLGLNDTDPRAWPNFKDEFIGDYLWLIDTLRHAGAKKVFIARMSPIFHGHRRFKAGTRDWYWQIQDAIEDVARISGAVLIDFNTPLKSRPDLMPDQLHPVALGAEMLAEEVCSAITGDYGGLKIPWGWTDNMVLQQGMPVTLHGKADRGVNVTVDLNRKKYRAKASETGRWSITMEPPEAGGPYTLTVSTDRNEVIKLDNILSGEVWLCSGQSNMELTVSNSDGADETLAICGDEGLRLLHFSHKNVPWNEPWDSATLATINELDFFDSACWHAADSNIVRNFSAVAYYFGNRLRKELGVPVGIIEMALGGSPAEAWIERKVIEMHPQMVDLLYDYRKWEMSEQWVRETMNTNLKKTENPLQRHPFGPAYLYESGIVHIARFPVKGFLWYQGESNAHFPELHEKILPALVMNWRDSWGNDRLPFYYAQLSSLNRPSWPEFRDSQRRLMQEIPFSGMIVTTDIGHPSDVHPRNKKTVGERFALLALCDTYGRQIQGRSPVPVRAEYEGGALVITFSGAGMLETSDGGKVREIEISVNGGLFRPAEAKIKKDKIIIDKKDITAVRYGWRPYSEGNLVNEAGLPVSTFKTEVKKTIE